MQDFEQNDVIGVYYGIICEKGGKGVKTNDYVMEVKWPPVEKNKLQKTLWIDPLKSSLCRNIKNPEPAYFGLHFMNDPTYKASKKNQPRTRSCCANVMVSDDLRAFAVRKIKAGEELLLDYNTVCG